MPVARALPYSRAATPRIVLLPLIAYAACGLVLSLGLHLLYFNAMSLTGEDTVSFVSFAVQIALFPLFLSAVLVWMKMIQAAPAAQPNACAIVLPACPTWLRVTIRALYIYVPVDFAIYLARSFAGTPAQTLPPVWSA